MAWDRGRREGPPLPRTAVPARWAVRGDVRRGALPFGLQRSAALLTSRRSVCCARAARSDWGLTKENSCITVHKPLRVLLRACSAHWNTRLMGATIMHALKRMRMFCALHVLQRSDGAGAGAGDKTRSRNRRRSGSGRHWPPATATATAIATATVATTLCRHDVMPYTERGLRAFSLLEIMYRCPDVMIYTSNTSPTAQPATNASDKRACRHEPAP